MSTSLDVDTIIRQAGPAPEDPPASEESGDNSRALAAAIAGVGAVISLATLVGVLLRGL
jgi:hypothetical protein